MMKKKWLALSSLLVGGATLLSSGCLGGFWNGFWNSGWPTNNQWLNLGIDVLKEGVIEGVFGIGR